MAEPKFTIDHDRMFKELLMTFFVEFVWVFLPEIAPHLEPDSIEFLDKEIFSDLVGGERREVDLIVKARFRGQDAFFIIHIENQASPQSDFPARLFFYFARLHEKYRLPVFPVAIFSYDLPRRPEPSRYEVRFPHGSVMQFKYKVIQLNRLSWRRYLKTPNPAAAALMTKMNIAEKDRLKVTREIVRMLGTLKLDPARSQLIGGFMETYLKLTAEEMKQYERKYGEPITNEEGQTMEMWTSWGREGMAKGLEQGRQEGLQEGLTQGLTQGKEEVLIRLIRKRFGTAAAVALSRLDALSAAQLNELAEALLDFSSVSDLENWLAQQNTQ